MTHTAWVLHHEQGSLCLGQALPAPLSHTRPSLCRVAEDVAGLPPAVDIDFVRVHCSPLLAAIGAEAGAWLAGVRAAMVEAEAPARAVGGWRERGCGGARQLCCCWGFCTLDE